MREPLVHTWPWGRSKQAGRWSDWRSWDSSSFKPNIYEAMFLINHSYSSKQRSGLQHAGHCTMYEQIRNAWPQKAHCLAMRWDITVRQGRQKVSKDAVESWTNGAVKTAYRESRNLSFLTMKASFSSIFGFTVMNSRYFKHQITAHVRWWGQQKIIIAKCVAVTSLYPVVFQWFY